MVSHSGDDTRFRVMRILSDKPDLSQREIARELGISLGRVNYCLKALVDKGHVKVQNFRAASNKMKYAYVLTPQGIQKRSLLAAGFLKRKLAEYDALRAEIEAVRVEVSNQADGVTTKEVKS